jgi:hypothetical protein
MSNAQVLEQMKVAVAAQRATLGTAETKVAEFPRNAVETIRVDLAPHVSEPRAGLVQIASWGSLQEGAREVYTPTAFECTVDDLPKLIAALQTAHASAHAPAPPTTRLQ